LASFFSYNLFFGPVGGGPSTADLASEKLLEDGTLANGQPHKALGFKTNILPGFRTPPAEVADLRLLHGSCRKPSNDGQDALAWVDDLLDPGVPRKLTPPLDAFPHMLLFTGRSDLWRRRVAGAPAHDQPAGQRAHRRDAGVPDHRQPAGGRHPGQPARRLSADAGVNAQCKFTTSSGNCHLLSFAEYCAMYVLVWCNAAWPATMPPPTDVDVTQKPGQARRRQERDPHRRQGAGRQELREAPGVLRLAPTS
jgi:hypothetical protein